MQGTNGRSWRISGIVFFATGLTLIVLDSGAGWVFFILGLSYLGRSTRQGDDWASMNPQLARALVVALTALALLVAAVLLTQKFLLS